MATPLYCILRIRLFRVLPLVMTLLPHTTPSDALLPLCPKPNHAYGCCRAKLDNTLQRLSRIISITEADHCRPSPRTVERALLGHGRRGMAEDELEQDLGAENTRQRLAYELAA